MQLTPDEEHALASLAPDDPLRSVVRKLIAYANNVSAGAFAALRKGYWFMTETYTGTGVGEDRTVVSRRFLFKEKIEDDWALVPQMSILQNEPSVPPPPPSMQGESWVGQVAEDYWPDSMKPFQQGDGR